MPLSLLLLRRAAGSPVSLSRSTPPERRIKTLRPTRQELRRRRRFTALAAPQFDQSAAANVDADEQRPTTSTAPPPPLSSRLRVVLVSPRTSANIGAACRASSNFGVEDLVVVCPRCDPFDDDASKLSRGVEAYRKIRVVEDLDAALEGAAAAVGVSRRIGGARRAFKGVRELLAAGVPGVGFAPRRRKTGSGSSSGEGEGEEEEKPLPLPPRPLALVFGREESGLTAEELARCSASLALRTSDNAPSLNLSAAVAVALALLQEEAARIDDEEEEEEVEEEDEGRRRAERSSSSSSSSSSASSPPPFSPSPSASNDIAPLSAVDALVLRVAELAVALELEEAARESAGGGGAHGRKLRLAGHARALLTRARASRAEVGAMHALLRAAEQRLSGVAAAEEGERGL